MKRSEQDSKKEIITRWRKRPKGFETMKSEEKQEEKAKCGENAQRALKLSRQKTKRALLKWRKRPKGFETNS